MTQNENKLSIYAGPPVRRVLEQANQENRSARLNAVCERYEAIVADELQRVAFTYAEWYAICDVENGTYMGDHGWQSSWANMMDSPEMDAKWDIDHEHLGSRLRALSLAGRCAVAEVVERFWSSPQLNELPNDELLRRAGAPLPDIKGAV